MKRHVYLYHGVILLSLLLGSSCFVDTSLKTSPAIITKQGPPSHAPAHGYRRKQIYYYRYYPSSYVYFDTGRKLYFHMEGDGWQVSAGLPAGISVDPGEAVSLSLETDKPYVLFHTHKAKYPPGQSKKHGGGATKGPGKTPGHGKKKNP